MTQTISPRSDGSKPDGPEMVRTYGSDMDDPQTKVRTNSQDRLMALKEKTRMNLPETAEPE